MKMKLLRCISILCTAAVLSAPFQLSLKYVQAKETIFDDNEISKDDRLLSKDGKFQYRLKQDGTITIVGYVGNSDTITVPAKIDGKTVSQIGMSGESEYSYQSNNEYVKNIVFPQGITIYSALAPNIEKISFSKGKSEKGTSILGIGDFNKNGDYTKLKEADLRQESHLVLGGYINSAFFDCTSLKKIYLPSSVQFSGYTFHRCTNLTDVYYDDTEKCWAHIANSIDDESSVLKAKKHFVAGKKNSYVNYSVEDNMDAPNATYHTYYCELLSNPVKECSFTPSSIRDEKEFKIPDTVVLYKGGDPVKVTEISSFGGKNDKTTSLTIGKNVTRILSSAFEGWSKLKKITIRSTKLKMVCSDAFKDIHPNATIKVPAKKLSAYKKLFKGYKVKITT